MASRRSLATMPGPQIRFFLRPRIALGPTAPSRALSTPSITSPSRPLFGPRPQIRRSPGRQSRHVSTDPTGLNPTDARVEGTISSGHSEPTQPEPPPYLSATERAVFDKLVASDLAPTKLEVQDISGGCGSMFAIEVVSQKFEGLPMIRQHRVVNDVLKGEIGGWHGVQLKTLTPAKAAESAAGGKKS